MNMKKYKLGDLLFEFHAGKAIQTENIKNKGAYPVYGGNGQRGYTNSYNQNGEYLIIGRQGAYCGNVRYNIGKAYLTEHAIVGQAKENHNPIYIALKLSLMNLSQLQGQSAQPGLSVNTLSCISMEMPPKEIQDKIADIMLKLDRKIELNRQINDNLEAMAKQLYDYWFVQFDFPNEEGRPYKSSGGAMVWNDKLKREIPKGWTSAKIKDAAHTYSGGTPTSTNSKYYDGGNIPWINSGELNNPIITSTTNYITEEGLNNSSAKLYPQDTVLVALYGATAGKVSLLSFEACSNQAVCGVIPQNKIMTTYIRYYLSSLYEHFITLSSGSARDNISQDTIKNTILPIPQEKILKEYSDSVVPIISKIIANQKEIENLTKQRDELLPLLMNGQATVNYHLSVLFITKIMLYYKETNINSRYERNNNTKRFRWNESGSVS